MKRLLIVSFLALPLGGCLTAQQAQDVATATMQVTCLGIAPADAAFQDRVRSGKVSANTIRLERDAVIVLSSICDSWALDPNFNLQAGLKAAAKAMAALLDAELQARAQAGG